MMELLKNLNNKKDGFTVIEMILVITIIVILSSVIVPRLIGRGEEARIAAAKLQVENISVALDAYAMDIGSYPTTDQGLEALFTTIGNDKNWKGPYLKKKITNDPWGNPYIYKSPGIYNKDYDLESFGPDGLDGGNDDIKSWE